MLKSLIPVEDKSQKTAYRQDILPPPRVCEACGKVVPVGHDAINCIIVIGSPGHPSMAPFQCPQEEHWACSIACWKLVAHACIDEHMVQVLTAMHNSMNSHVTVTEEK